MRLHNWQLRMASSVLHERFVGRRLVLVMVATRLRPATQASENHQTRAELYQRQHRGEHHKHEGKIILRLIPPPRPLPRNERRTR